MLRDLYQTQICARALKQYEQSQVHCFHRITSFRSLSAEAFQFCNMKNIVWHPESRRKHDSRISSRNELPKMICFILTLLISL